MLDVLIVGAGPAGSVAATILARAGARVRLVDRSTFPRDKLCGDTVNPGTLAILRRLNVAASIETCGLPVAGMRVTGERGVVIEGRYPDGVRGRALLRRHLDWMLLQDALSAGAQFEPAFAVAARACRWKPCRRRVAERTPVRRRTAGPCDDRGRRPAFNAGVRPRPGPPSRASAPLGDRRVSGEHRRRDTLLAISARCTCEQADTSASPRCRVA